MNYVITTPHEGFLIGLISGAIIYGILYNVFIENTKNKNKGIHLSLKCDYFDEKQKEETFEIKTESTPANLLNDTCENIRDHILNRPKEETNFSNSISNPELSTYITNN